MISLRYFRPLAALALLLVTASFYRCESDKPAANGTPEAPAAPFEKNKGVTLPAGLEPANVTISSVNQWIENQQFVAVGIVENNALFWQRIFLKITFQDANGQPVQCNGQAEMFIPVATNVVPPRGRSGFCWSWDMSQFSAPPAKCQVEAAGALRTAPKAILVPVDVSMVNVMTGAGKTILDTTVQTSLTGHQVSFAIFNGTDIVAQKPMAQIMVFGKDNKIWHSNVLLADSTDQVVYAGKSGPLMPQEKRVVGFGMLLSALPIELQKAGMGKVEFFPFDAQQ